MAPDEYQKLAARTRCPQDMALPRLESGPFYNEQRRQFPNASGVHPPAHSGAMLLHGQLGATGEMGELASAIEKYMFYNQPFDRNNVIYEIGDVLWYLCEMCDALDIGLEQVMELNIAKLRKRFPEKYSDERALEENRDRVAEGDAVGPNAKLNQAMDDGVSYE
jgi:NTP pyrophosphatase (non-canonical NTP hydrolase)